MIQLALIHPQPLYRQGLELVLTDLDDMEVVAAVGTLRELLQQFPKAILDVILWELPDHHTLPAGARILKECYPLAKILVIASNKNALYTGLLVTLGAAAVVRTDCTADQMQLAILKAHDSYAPPPSSNHVQEPALSSVREVDLSLRELEVLHLICTGLTDQQIGQRLQISKRTVDNHRMNLRKKLGANNTAKLVRIALEKKLIPIKINQK